MMIADKLLPYFLWSAVCKRENFIVLAFSNKLICLRPTVFSLEDGWRRRRPKKDQNEDGK